MPNTILWKKWRDPLNTVFQKQVSELFDDAEADDYKRRRAEFLGDDPADLDDEDDDEFDDDDDDDFIPFGFHPHKPRRPIGPSVVGPMGIIPLHEHNLPSKLFNFWMGHTNFKLDDVHIDQIKSVNGIESLDVFTRHRFRASFGLAFDDAEVRKTVSDLFVAPAPQAKPTPLHLMSLGLGKKFKFWTIHRANGRTAVYGAETREEVMTKTQNLEGELITSWA